MDKVETPAWLPAIEGVRVESATGALWPDGWISREVTITCTARVDLRNVEIHAWNPDVCAVYAHNIVSLSLDGEEVQSPELYMGEPVQLRIDKPIEAGRRFVLGIASKVARPADGLDARERGVVVSKLAVELARKSEE